TEASVEEHRCRSDQKQDSRSKPERAWPFTAPRTEGGLLRARFDGPRIGFSAFDHFRNEPESPSRDGRNALWGARIVAEHLSQQEDLLTEAGLFDCRIRPELTEQFAFRDDAVPVLDQDLQGINRLGCDGNSGSTTQQQAFRGVETKRAEREHRGTAHAWSPLMPGIRPSPS